MILNSSVLIVDGDIRIIGNGIDSDIERLLHRRRTTGSFAGGSGHCEVEVDIAVGERLNRKVVQIGELRRICDRDLGS